jgi:magnesium-transporting ATPase (P-type)
MRYIWYINIGALLLAILPLPYLYYMALRWLVVGSAAYFLIRHQRRWKREMNGWNLLFIGVAVLYNPIIPIQLPKLIWIGINVGTAFLFYRHLLLDPHDELDG